MKRQRIAYLLTCLSEECAELAKEASKALRFGPHDSYEGTTPHQRMEIEYADLLCVLDELRYAGLPIEPDRDTYINKPGKLRKAMRYSRKVGFIKP